MTGKATSIRRHLLAKLMAPLLALVLLGGLSAYAVAYYYSQSVLDQWLYDSAITLAHQLHWADDRVQVDLSGSALEVFELDVADRIYYQVWSDRTGRVLANADVEEPPRAPKADGRPVYYDTAINGTPVRAIALVVASPSNDRVLIKVAETRKKRGQLASEVLYATLILAVVMALGSAVLIWWGIGSGLHALERVVRKIRVNHSEAPLAPLPYDAAVPSEVRPLVDEINELIASLDAAYRGQRRFVIDAAHQLRTPLASLRVQIELAARKASASTELQSATRELARITHLVHQLLALARADEHGEAPETTSIDLVAVARAEVEAQWDRAGAAGCDLGYTGATQPLFVAASETLLREALANLVDNAIRYAAPGPITVGVESATVSVFVEDQGPGIAPNLRERVFDRFYRIPGTPGEGCGLGLAIVGEISRRYGARVEIGGAQGGAGTRVAIRFEKSAPRSAGTVDAEQPPPPRAAAY